ncbi:hypothetical protein LTR37_008782 [Vermiconidia calcicola]|uniref:Uncharacterized protein n=1 Tax=Vermiconidia calcicola TaxID=1690605 RepID=A0ACC3NAR1_9PEZI|nr:hypothetical protein LTR37_008782 [Vermiconidia calcicola]
MALPTPLGESPLSSAWEEYETAKRLSSVEESFSWHSPPMRATSERWNLAELKYKLPFEGQRASRHDEDSVLDDATPLAASQDMSVRAGPSATAPDPSIRQGYMALPSMSALGNSITDTSFLDAYPKGDATLTYSNDRHTLESICNVNIELIGKCSAVLALAFEDSRSGPRLHLETLTPMTALPFLRFLYCGCYAVQLNHRSVAVLFEDVPTSLYLHCQLYHLGDIYEIQDLKTQAYVNVLRQLEFGCSSPDKPIHLCKAIEYAYDHLREHEKIIDAIINYCVSCFLRHRLAQDKGFSEVAYRLRSFHQDLCKNALDRVDSEAAAAIIQMPFKPYIPETYASRQDVPTKRLDDVVYHFHASDDVKDLPKKRKRPVRVEKQDNVVALPLRPRSDPSQDLIDPAKSYGAQQNEADKLGRKRRASSVAGPSAPTLDLLSQLLHVEKEVEALSDTEAEYDMIELPLHPEETSDSDSDFSTLVGVNQEDLGETQPQPLAIRTRETETAPDVSAIDSDSDTDWSLV